MIPRRGTIVVEAYAPTIKWDEADRFIPAMRLTAIWRMAGKRRRMIWHHTAQGRAVYLPIEVKR